MSNEKKTNTQNGTTTNVVNKSTIIELPYGSQDIRRSKEDMKTVLLPKILKKLMKDNELSVRQLAKDCKVPLSTISSYLSDPKASYSPEHLACLSDYFEVSIDYLLFGKTKPDGLSTLPTELVYQGWLKVKILRAIPIGNDGEKDPKE